MQPDFKKLLGECRRIALVGISSKPDRASYQVAAYLKAAGYALYPVNPAYTQVLGLTCYPSLADIPVDIDLVDVFRRAEDCPPIAEAAIAIGAKVLWLQLGIVSPVCRQLAAAAGMTYVEDHCIKIEHSQLNQS